MKRRAFLKPLRWRARPCCQADRAWRGGRRPPARVLRAARLRDADRQPEGVLNDYLSEGRDSRVEPPRHRPGRGLHRRVGRERADAVRPGPVPGPRCVPRGARETGRGREYKKAAATTSARPSTTRPTRATRAGCCMPSPTSRSCACPPRQREEPAAVRAADLREPQRDGGTEEDRDVQRGGEIALFDRIGLRPVFFGQTLAGPRQPNLVYMTVHADMAAREKTWDTFRNDDGWKKLSGIRRSPNTVSATTVVFLRPAAYSQV